MDLAAQMVETWQIHDRIHQYLLAEIATDQLGDVSASKGRSVGEQLAHVHNVRLMWLKSAAPELLAGLEKVEKEEAGDKAGLVAALEASGKAIAALLEQALASGGKIKGFKPHVTTFLGYLIAHESHHRGQLLLTLKQNKHAVSQKVGFGLWEWGVR